MVAVHVYRPAMEKGSTLLLMMHRSGGAARRTGYDRMERLTSRQNKSRAIFQVQGPEFSILKSWRNAADTTDCLQPRPSYRMDGRVGKEEEGGRENSRRI